MPVRGVRGAITASENSKEAILSATKKLLEEMIISNKIQKNDIASAFFTTTTDLDAEFPAVAARQLGWTMVPLMCGNEMAVPGSLQKVIRVMLHLNTDQNPEDIQHIYLGKAQSLRPELGRDK
tara:strand:+ start:3595 stop:3963 length:369 start_codon:yes stop_codon:yes gene_type:complete